MSSLLILVTYGALGAFAYALGYIAASKAKARERAARARNCTGCLHALAHWDEPHRGFGETA